MNDFDSTLSGTLKGTLFTTAKTGLGVHSGTGTTLEVMSSDKQVRISGYFAAIASLNIEIMDNVTQDDIEHHTSSYVSVIFHGKNYVTPYEVHDILHGLG